ncbi:MAG: flagellar motor protein MotB [Alphaproteobacteria bacterium]
MAADGGAKAPETKGKADPVQLAPIIIKKVKKGHGDGHHGGAWKVAYADFVTAMMAFFLLLWLLNATTEEQKAGISNYFAPEAITYTKSGSGGLMGGAKMTKAGPGKSDNSPVGLVVKIPKRTDGSKQGQPGGKNTDGLPGGGRSATSPGGNEKAGLPGGKNIEGQPGGRVKNGPRTDAERRRAADQKRAAQRKAKFVPRTKAEIRKAAETEEKAFKKAAAEIRKAIAKSPELKEFAKNLVIDRSPRGLRIQLVDRTNTAMFPRGSSRMPKKTKRLLARIASVIIKFDNNITIAGHTDSVKYIGGGGYSNWELSAGRANASRRFLKRFGVPAHRIVEVVGRADRDPLIKDKPEDPRNRRISIILLRKFKPEPKKSAAKPKSEIKKR